MQQLGVAGQQGTTAQPLSIVGQQGSVEQQQASADNSRVSPDKDSWASPDNKEPPHDQVVKTSFVITLLCFSSLCDR